MNRSEVRELFSDAISFYNHVNALANALGSSLKSRLERNGLRPEYLLDNLLGYVAWKLTFPEKTYVLDELKRFDFLMQGDNFQKYRAAWERARAAYERELKPLGGLAASYEKLERSKGINKWALALLALLAGGLTSTLLYAAFRPKPMPERIKPLDSDNDGLEDWDEQRIYGTDPTDWDTDDDTLSDHDEVKLHKTNPLKADTDGDGLKDGEEVNVYATNPLKSDSDEDGWNDYEEVYLLDTNPMKRNRYEIAKQLLGEKLAIQLHLAAGDEDFREAVDALKELSDECKQLLYESRVVEEIARDGILTKEELKLLKDLDKDNLPNAEDAFPFNPFNHHKLKDAIRLWILRTSYWNLTKPSLIEVYGKEALEFAMDVLERNEKLRDAAGNFSFSQAGIYAYLCKYLRELFDHPDAIVPAVRQIDSVIYSRGVHEVRGETYVWEKGIRPAILFVDKLEDAGEINCLDYDDWEWYSSDLISIDECIGQILLPMELAMYKIDTGEGWFGSPRSALEIMVYNLTPNEKLGGRTPQEWQRDVLLESLEKRDEWYKEALDCGLGWTPSSVWPNSGTYFDEICEELRERDMLPILIRGYPHSFRVYRFMELDPDSQFTGADYPFYSVLIGRCLGRVVFVVGTLYPRPPGAKGELWHEEAAILTPYGKHEWLVPYGFCFYMSREAFLKDYEDFDPPKLEVYVGGKAREISLED